jgi:NADH oxidase (H2O2-forming)
VENKILPVDCVIIAAGVRPQVDLALRAGLDIGSTGGIVTDKYLRVSLNKRFLNNVYAGGECAQVSNFITESPIIAGLGPAARRMARVIGENISKKSSADASVYPSTLSPTVIAIKDLAAGSVGITSHTADRHNIQVVSGISKGYTKAKYCPDASPLHIKLLFLRLRLVGAQVVAKEGVKERIDALGLAIRMGATIDDLLTWETSYAPPVSMVIDPVTLAAYNAKKKMVE